MIFTSLILVAVGGIGVDLIVAEYKRVNVQNTLDRAVLAAADLEQVLDPDVVVRDYFDKMALDGTLTSVRTQEGLNFKDVTGTADMEVPANFTRLLGQQSYRTGGTAQAVERIANVEISLVLDVSGSMVSNNKMANLKTAANTFIDTVL